MQAWQMDRGVGLLHRASRYQSLGLYSLLGLGLLIRLFLARGPGYFDDLQLYVNWGALLDKHFFDFYSAGASISPQPNYPPLAIYIYGILTYLYGVWAHLAGARPDLLMGGAQGLNIVMKLPTLICELGLTAAIYTLARRTVPSRRYAYLVAAAYAFSPVVLMDGPVWGQIDAAYTLGLTLALLATVRGRGLLAGVLFGLALMLKPQPVVFAPLLLVYLWRWSGGRQALRAAAGAAGTILLVCLPYLLPPRFEILVFQQDEGRIIAALPNTTLSGFNLWWLLGAQHVRYSQPYLGPLSPNLLGWGLLALTVAIVLAGVWRAGSPGRLWGGAGVVAMAFFVLAPLQHERYLYPAVALFLVAALYDKRMWLFYAAASVTTLANMIIIVIHPVVSSSGLNLPTWSAFIGQHSEISLVIAAANVMLLLSGIVAYFSWHPAAAMAASGSLASGTAFAHRGAVEAATFGIRRMLGRDSAEMGAEQSQHRRLQEKAGMSIMRQGRQLQAWSATREGKAFFGLLAVSLLIRMMMLPYRGFYDDMQAFANWGDFLNHHFLHFYSQGPAAHPIPDYPPLAMYLFGLLDGLYVLAFHLVGKTPILHIDYSRTLAALFRTPIVLADLGLIITIYLVARRLVSKRVALLAAASYALSPVILFGGVLWGQIDLLFILGLTLALLATVRGRGLLAGVLFGLALMLKPQPVVFAPLLLVYLWRWSGGRQALRAAAGAAGTILLVCLPYLLPPRFEVLAYQQDLDRWVKAVPYTSVSAFNLWWMLGIQKMPYTAPYLGPLSPNVVGWALFIVVLAITVASTWNDSFPGRLFFSVGLLTVAMFIVLPLQHERYVLPAVVFFLLAALYEKRHAVFYVATSIMALLNMVLVVIAPVFSDSRIPYNLAKGRHFLRMHPQVFTALAAIDVLLFVAMVVVYLRQMRKAQPAVIAAESPAAWSLAGLAEPRHAPVQYAPSWHSSAAVKTLSVNGESADLDSTFWTGVRATCSALAHNDTWMARLCLDSIVAAIMSPLARRERDVSSSDVLPDRCEEHQPSRVQIVHWRTPEDAHNVLDALYALIANYRDLRQRLQCGGSGGEPSLREREAMEALAEVGRQPAISASEALTGCSLSMVLPAYREEAVIANTVQACLRAAERFCPNVEVIVVNDGSRDRTGEIIDGLAEADPRVVALHHPVNMGYGAALLTGFAFARGDLLFFMDSDGQFDVREIAYLLRTEAQQPGVVVIGYRAHRRDTTLRIVNAWGWKHLVGLILGLRGIRDIDCAFKLFPTRLVQACQVTSEGAMVNTELLAKLQRMRVPLVQVPVQHFPRMHGQATGANLSVIAKAFRELLRLRLRLHVWQPPAADAPAARGGMGDNADLVYEMESSATPSPVA